jgi:hypothetical protein
MDMFNNDQLAFIIVREMANVSGCLDYEMFNLKILIMDNEQLGHLDAAVPVFRSSYYHVEYTNNEIRLLRAVAWRNDFFRVVVPFVKTKP